MAHTVKHIDLLQRYVNGGRYAVTYVDGQKKSLMGDLLRTRSTDDSMADVKSFFDSL